MPKHDGQDQAASPLVHLAHLTKDYGRNRALDDVSLSIEGGITGLLGPNGSGKTTLIKVMLGLVKMNRGEGSLLGLRVGADSRAIRDRVGYMPEDDCYIAGLSGIEMIQFMARLSGLPSREALRRGHEILDFCGVHQERYRRVETYSSGMRQKLKFAQAIVHDPPLLILDEPTSALDPEERQAMLARVRILAEKANKAVIVSTHILPDVQAICRDVIILSRGRVRLIDRLENLSRPASPSYRLRVAGSAEQALGHFQRGGLEAAHSGEGVIAVADKDGQVHDAVWRIAHREQIGIVELSPALNSLEEVFLAAVREAK